MINSGNGVSAQSNVFIEDIMTFTLSLLGTSTDYMPNTSSDYDRGESLSFATTLVEGNQCVVADAKEPYQGDYAYVINGPDNFGYQVGDRIARAVLCILQKIADGETQIDIIAHSRGAVEAILVAHELQRIQRLANPLNNDEMTNSEDRSNKWFSRFDHTTYLAMKTEPLASKFAGLIHKVQEADPVLFQTNLQRTKLAIFNIDPVPGGNRTGFQTSWRDDRFYQIPDNVSEYVQCVYQHEYSRSFKVIIPKPVDPSKTQFQLIPLPGHHGTGSGNLFDQTRTPTSLANRNLGLGKTSDVQDIVLLKIIRFLKRNGDVQFKRRDQLVALRLNDNLMNLLFDGRAILSQEDLLKKELECYGNLYKNMKNYEYFKSTTYVTGMEQAWLAVFNPRAVVDDRFVHYHEHLSKKFNKFLREVTPSVNGPYVNADHANLAFGSIYKRFGIVESMCSLEKVSRMMGHLMETCRHLGMNDRSLPADPSHSFIAKKEDPSEKVLLEIASNDTDLYNDCAELFTQQIAEAYLNGQIKGEERAPMLELITEGLADMFLQIETKKFKGKGLELAVTLYEKLQAGIQNTLQKKSDALQCDISFIEAHLRRKEVDYASNLLNNLENISEHLDPSIAGELHLNEMKEELRALILEGSGSKIKACIERFQPRETDPEEAVDEPLEKAKSNIAAAMSSASDGIEGLNNSMQVLSELIGLYNAVDQYVFLVDKLGFSESMSVDVELLRHRKTFLMNAIKDYIYNNMIDVTDGVVVELLGDLYPIVEQHLTARTAQNPINYRLCQALDLTQQRLSDSQVSNQVLLEQLHLQINNNQRLIKQGHRSEKLQNAGFNQYLGIFQEKKRDFQINTAEYQAVDDFICRLNAAKTAYLDCTTDLQTFREACNSAIKTAEASVLSEYPWWKAVFVALFGVIATIVTLSAPLWVKGKLGLFNWTSEPSEKLTQFEANIALMTPDLESDNQDRELHVEIAL